MSMGDTTTLPEEQANVNPTDAIAELLVEDSLVDDETEEATGDLEVSEDETEEEADESTDEVDESSDEEVEEEGNNPETWAEALGVEDNAINLDDKGNITGINIKVDGVSDTVDMKTLIAGYQTSKHNTHSSKALASERKEFVQVRDNAYAEYTKKLNDVKKLTEYMHGTLMQEYEGVDWGALRAQDPAEYAAAYQDFDRKKQELQKVYSTIEQEHRAELDNSSKSEQEANQKHLASELDKVKADNPEWDTDAKLQEGFREIGAFADTTYGLSQEAFNSLSDARFIAVLKDAMSYHKGKKVALKKVKQNLPKFQKSKSRTASKKVSKLDKLTKHAKTQSGANRRDAEVSAIAELLSGG